MASKKSTKNSAVAEKSKTTEDSAVAEKAKTAGEELSTESRTRPVTAAA
jgi:hypothetical protein